MLDSFEILTTSGVVIWSRSYASVNPSVINNFIADTFIEEKSGSSALREAQAAGGIVPAYKGEHHTLKWTLVKELGVIFVVSISCAGRGPQSWQPLTRLFATGRLPFTATPDVGRQVRREHQDDICEPVR